VDFTDAEFSILEDSSVVAAISLAMDGRILGANAYLRRFFGVGNNSDLAGRALREFLVHEDDWALWAAGGQVTTQLRSPAGKVLVLRGDVRSSRLPSGRRLYGIFVEVADEQPLRAAAQHSARMEALGSLTAGIAHDFNNLLTVLVGNIYLVAEELRDRPKAFERIKAARDAGKRGAELIKQLLAFARREQLDHGVVDPCKVVDGIVPLLRRAVGTRITLEMLSSTGFPSKGLIYNHNSHLTFMTKMAPFWENISQICLSPKASSSKSKPAKTWPTNIPHKSLATCAPQGLSMDF
jgi:signal transduction histidine kinase